MNATTNSRIGWTDLPAGVRVAVERIIGGEVVAAVSQPGGFSPGTADRVRTADGHRAFVKAVGSAQNDRSPDMHRQEPRNAAALPGPLRADTPRRRRRLQGPLPTAFCRAGVPCNHLRQPQGHSRAGDAAPAERISRVGGSGG
ncbi:hypothetical protein GA0074694_3482 [Micromonospora inyonensis]|uniref:Uncharacterized protein n=1 Tax=Micromonospora inyonensis TaxID=47866 RepID=A0A1C6S070_9ACTN|nr:hypothetical protein GA0074694_3482 [Micromonospora inyonensis]